MRKIDRLAASASLLALSTITGCASNKARSTDAPTPPVRLMSPQDLQALPSRAADFRIAYGTDSSQFGDLRVPAGTGPHPVAILIHGGCFKAMYATNKDLAPMADALKDSGIATWNIEYRRLGHPGGGWPGTYLDVSRAVDHLRTIASQHQLDLNRVVIVGHSAGGHLAMWTASRARVPTNSEIYTANPLPVRGVINLAGPIDMTANIQGYEGLCRDTVITSLMGGSPQAVPEHYSSASINKLVPLGVPQVLIIGEFEEFLPRPIAESYVRAATQSGDRARLIVIPRAGHFEIASPSSPPWPQVVSAIRSLIDGKLPE